jgi:hypothetical protein
MRKKKFNNEDVQLLLDGNFLMLENFQTIKFLALGCTCELSDEAF